MRKFLLPVAAMCALFAFVPMASAKTHNAQSPGKVTAHIAANTKQLTKSVQGLGKGVAYAVNHDKINEGRIDTIVGQIAYIVPEVTSALTQLQAGLLAIQAALNDKTTGLVGLNLARPKFATVTTTAGVSTVAGATPSFGGVTRAAAGTYVLDFGQDVSQRSISVSALPGTGAVVGEAVDCGNTTACPGGDTNKNHVLVLTYVLAASSTVAADAGFTATAIAG